MPKIKSRQKTGGIALVFHWFMILCTCGLWYPIYASRRRSRVTVTHVPAGYGQPPAYGPPQQRYAPPPPQQWGPPRR